MFMYVRAWAFNPTNHSSYMQSFNVSNKSLGHIVHVDFNWQTDLPTSWPATEAEPVSESTLDTRVCFLSFSWCGHTHAEALHRLSHKRGHTDFLMLVLEWRVNYGVMERLFSTGWKVEAPPDISMPVCLKANFTLHAPGTKPSKNLHFNRIPSSFTHCFLETGA